MARRASQFSWPSAALGMLGLASLSAAPAAAKPPSKARVEISANAGVLAGGSTFTESDAFPLNVETETVTVNHGVKAAGGFDVGAALKIAPQFWIGAQVAMGNTKASASVSALVPHPLLFNTPRTVQGSIGNVTHNEQNVHADVMYALPVHALEVKIMAGPTFFNLEQDFVSGIAVTETYPFDTAAFASATTTKRSKGAVGFNAGVDVSRPLSPHVGIGGVIRYGRANVKFDQQTVKAGGIEAGGGVRVWF